MLILLYTVLKSTEYYITFHSSISSDRIIEAGSIDGLGIEPRASVTKSAVLPTKLNMAEYKTIVQSG